MARNRKPIEIPTDLQTQLDRVAALEKELLEPPSRIQDIARAKLTQWAKERAAALEAVRAERARVAKKVRS